MANAIKVTQAFATLLETCNWVIVNGNHAVGAYPSRQAAREAKAVKALEGSIKNKSEVEFVVIAPKAPKATPVKTNGPVLHKSEVERPCKLVWAIADAMKGAKRKEVLAECVRQGIAFYTARTQYQQWLGIQKEMAEREAQQTKAK